MDIRTRAETFTRYVGLELKGKITARGRSAKAVAEETGHSPAAFNRWLNGKVDLPLIVLYEACEVIGVVPAVIVDSAWERLRGDGVATPVVSVDVGDPVDTDDVPLAAKRGEKKGDAGFAE